MNIFLKEDNASTDFEQPIAPTVGTEFCFKMLKKKSIHVTRKKIPEKKALENCVNLSQRQVKLTDNFVARNGCLH